MGEIIPFRRSRPSERHKGRTLCRSGFHKWEIVQEKQFDVRAGKLVTIERCRRCGTQRTRAL